jgi:propanediol dehydratase small subunit
LVIGHFYTVFPVRFDPQRDYPLGMRRPDLVETPGGRSLGDLELGADWLDQRELRATPATLRLQADVADAAGRPQLAANLRRAAELAPFPDETLLAIYTALRPGRSSAEELEAWAVRLEERGAPLSAAFVREALEVYVARGLLAI